MTSPATAPASTTVTVSDGVRLVVTDEGSGPPVVLLHGFPDSRRLWDGVAPLLLAAGRRVITLDQRGFGESDAPDRFGAYAVDRLVADVVETLDALGVDEEVDVVGHDWGSIISWLLAIRHADRVHRHVTISVGHPTAFARAGVAQKLKSTYMVWFHLGGLAERYLTRNDFAAARALLDPHPAIDAVQADMSRPGRLTAGLRWYRRNVAGILVRRIPDCPTPTLGIHPASDRYLDRSQMESTARYMRAEWRWESVPGGHWVALEDPERVAGLVDGWLGTR